jgi:hypothetical protein
MRRWIGLPAIAAAALLAWAGDAKQHDVEWRERWKAGQVVTVEEHSTEEIVSPMKNEKTAVDVVYVVRCDEADADGRPTKRTVHVKSFKKVVDDVADESISGKTLAVDGRTWKLADGSTPSRIASGWLNAMFTRDPEEIGDMLKAFDPPKQMSVGETWKPDPKKVREYFMSKMKGLPLAEEGVKLEMTLTSVTGADGTFDAVFRLPLGAAPGMPPDAKLTSDSVMDAKWHGTGPLTDRTVGAEESSLTMKMSMDMGGQVMEMAAVKKAGKTTKTAGGEIPAAAAPAPAPAPGVK